MHIIIYIMICEILGRLCIFVLLWDTWISVVQKVYYEKCFLWSFYQCRVCDKDGVGREGEMEVGIRIMLLSDVEREGENSGVQDIMQV